MTLRTLRSCSAGASVRTAAWSCWSFPSHPSFFSIRGSETRWSRGDPTVWPCTTSSGGCCAGRASIRTCSCRATSSTSLGPGLARPAPDVSVVRGLANPRRSFTSYNVRKEGIAPCLLIEVVSPGSARIRNVDEQDKVVHYQKAGIREYLLLDLPRPGNLHPPQLPWISSRRRGTVSPVGAGCRGPPALGDDPPPLRSLSRRTGSGCHRRRDRGSPAERNGGGPAGSP